MTFGIRRRVALFLTTALLLSACGGGAVEDPKELLVNALRALANQPGLTITLSLDTDEASLRALSNEPGEIMPEELIEVLPTTEITFSVPLGDESATEAAAIAFLLSGEERAGIRVVDGDLYVRADVRAIVEAFGEDPAMVDGIEAMVSQSGMLPEGALSGQWIVIRGVQEALEGMGATGDGATALPDIKSREAVERLGRVLADATTVEHLGSDADGEHLRVTVPVREVYAALMDEAKALGLPTPMGPTPNPEDVPDVEIPVHLWISDGMLAVASLDIRDLIEMDPDTEPLSPEVEKLSLRMEFSSFDGKVEIPSGAKELNLESIMSMLMGAIGSSMGGMGGGMDQGAAMPSFGGGGNSMADNPDYDEARAYYCEQVKDMPKEQHDEYYAEMCPAG